MSVKWIKRAIMAAPFLIAGGIGIVWLLGVWWERSEMYSVAAGRYHEYAEAYRPLGENEYSQWTSCYGQRWDRYTDDLIRDRIEHHDDPVYLAERAARYRRLASKYKRAAAQPWRSLRVDPPMDSH